MNTAPVEVLEMLASMLCFDKSRDCKDRICSLLLSLIVVIGLMTGCSQSSNLAGRAEPALPAGSAAEPGATATASDSGEQDPDAVAAHSGSTAVITPSAPIHGYHLTFDDEFNSLSVSNDPYLDHTLWCSCSWWYPALGTANMHTNGGLLQMEATEAGSTWTGAHLSTWSPSEKGFSQRFGYWEIRFKPSGQTGILDDFYLISEQSILTNGAYPTNEIDIFEKPKGNIIYLTLKNGNAADGWRWNELPVPQNFDSQYHTLGLLWEQQSGYIKWYLDGKLVWTAPKYNDTDMSPMIMTLETDVNGAYGVPDSTTANPSTFNVDYVRVWSNDPNAHLWTASQ